MKLFFLTLLLLAVVLQQAHASCPPCMHGTCPSGAQVCSCDAGWIGVDCSLRNQQLVSGVTLTNQRVEAGQWLIYQISVPAAGPLFYDVQQSATSGASQDCDLYVQRNAVPTSTSYLYRDITTSAHFQINISSAAPGTWYAGVYGFSACTFAIKATLPSSGCPNACSSHGTCGANLVCSCSAGWTGLDCATPVPALPTSGSGLADSVANGGWKYYSLTTQSNWQSVDVLVSQTSPGDVDLFVRRGTAMPTLSNFEYANFSVSSVSYVNLTSLVAGDVFAIGVYGFSGCTYNIRAVPHTFSGASSCRNQCSLHGSCVQQSCSCSSGYSGSQCETMLIPLRLSSNYVGYVGDNAWNYYHITAQTSNSLNIALSQSSATPQGDCDLYVKQGSNPTRTSYDYMDISDEQSFSLSLPQSGSVTWYIGIYGWYPCQYSLIVTETSTCACVNGQSHGHCNSGSTVCVCDAGWSGELCDQGLVMLSNGNNLDNQNVGMNQWVYYQITTRSSYFQVAIKEYPNTAGPSSTGNLWLFVSKTGDFPTLNTFDDADQTPSVAIHYADFSYNTIDTHTYTIGVYGTPFINSQTALIRYQIVAWSPPQ